MENNKNNSGAALAKKMAVSLVCGLVAGFADVYKRQEYYSAELALKVARGERENALQCKDNGGVVPLGFTIGKEDRLYHICLLYTSGYSAHKPECERMRR